MPDTAAEALLTVMEKAVADILVIVAFHVVSGVLGVAARDQVLIEVMEPDVARSLHSASSWRPWAWVLLGPLATVYFQAVLPWWQGMSDRERKDLIADAYALAAGIDPLNLGGE